MAIDLTSQYIGIDKATDSWQKQVIDAFSHSDANGGADVTATTNLGVNQDNNAGNNTTGWNINGSGANPTASANSNGYVMTEQNNAVKVDGSAFLYVNDRMTTKLTNKASGLASASKINDQINKSLERKLGV